MWIYIKSEPNLYTVGFYDPEGNWQTDSDHENKQKAANQTAFLNGSPDITFRQQRDELIEALLILYGAATAIHKQEAAWQGVFERTRATLASIKGDE